MTQSQILLWGAVVIIGIIVVAQFYRRPGKLVWWLVKSAAVGSLLILAVNFVGHYFHYHLVFNPWTASVAGVLGVPGTLALVALNLWLFPS